MKKLFTNENFKMLIRFGCVGVINTVIDTVVFFLLCDIAKLCELAANTLSYLVSATNSYFMNSWFVYRADEYSFRQFFRFLAGNIFVLIISSGSILLFAQFFKVKTTAKLISIPITGILNFLIQRFIIFGKSIEEKTESGME